MESELVAIEAGETVVLLQDEVHLCHGDVCGYVWGTRNTAVEIPMSNARLRQTYYGALNPVTGQLHLQGYESGNSTNTVSYLEKLREWYPKATKIWLVWDNASYHRSLEVKAYLAKVNEGLEAADWKMTCMGFAPNAPEQNPIEDAWLKAKNFLRKNFVELTKFSEVKKAFETFFHDTRFFFNKFKWYGFE